MFDLTKDIKLDAAARKTYKRAQAFLYAFSIAVACYLSYLMLFPKMPFNYSFDTSGLKNTIILTTSNSQPIDHGRINGKDGISFDASPSGNFSGADISITIDKESAAVSRGRVEIKKSYRAFFYPSGKPIGFSEGSLIKNGGNYYVISEGRLRKFKNENDLLALGYSPQTFAEVDEEDMKHNELGLEISKDNYPNGTIFKIADEYYLLSSGELKKFISPQAFSTHYDTGIVIEKNEDFFSIFPISETFIGFSDGTTISYADGVYIVSGEKVLPVDLPSTYEAKNYDWASLIPANADEFSFYKKDRIFTISSPHPNGTIFFAADSKKSYLIRDGIKLLLPTPAIAASWTKNKPIEVLEKNIDESLTCELQKEKLSLRTYGCRIALSRFAGTTGSEYAFHATFEEDVQIDRMNVTFFKDVNQRELKASLSAFLNRIKGTYNGTQN